MIDLAVSLAHGSLFPHGVIADSIRNLLRGRETAKN